MNCRIEKLFYLYNKYSLNSHFLVLLVIVGTSTVLIQLIAYMSYDVKVVNHDINDFVEGTLENRQWRQSVQVLQRTNNEDMNKPSEHKTKTSKKSFHVVFSTSCSDFQECMLRQIFELSN